MLQGLGGNGNSFRSAYLLSNLKLRSLKDVTSRSTYEGLAVEPFGYQPRSVEGDERDRALSVEFHEELTHFSRKQ